jgi:hypothetical protein
VKQSDEALVHSLGELTMLNGGLDHLGVVVADQELEFHIKFYDKPIGPR